VYSKKILAFYLTHTQFSAFNLRQ